MQMGVATLDVQMEPWPRMLILMLFSTAIV